MANRQPEMRNYNPTLIEKIYQLIGGDTREGVQAARRVIEPLDVPLGFTPAGMYDVGRSVAPDIGNLWDMISGGKAVTQPAKKTKDQFFAERRSPRKTLEQAEIEAEDKARQSPEYKDLMARGQRTNAQRLVDSAKKSARATWNAGQGTIGDEDARIEADWQSYLKDLDRARTEELSKPFVERNPGTATAMSVGGGLAAAALTRGVFGKVNKYGDELARRAVDQKAAGNIGDHAQTALQAQKWEKWAPRVKATTAVGAATIPADLRMMGDIIDRKTLPEDAPARHRADERMSDLWEYGKGLGWDLFSGLVGSTLGAKTAPYKTAPVDVYGVTSNLRGLDAKNLAPDQLAIDLAQRAIAAERASQKLAKVRQKNALPPPIPGGGGGTPQGPTPLPAAPATPAPAPAQIQGPAPPPAMPQVAPGNASQMTPRQQGQLRKELKNTGFALPLGYALTPGEAIDPVAFMEWLRQNGLQSY